MINKIKLDASAWDEFLLDILIQSCGNLTTREIDNQCLSVYEEACDYLTERGYLQASNGRIYKVLEIKLGGEMK